MTDTREDKLVQEIEETIYRKLFLSPGGYECQYQMLHDDLPCECMIMAAIRDAIRLTWIPVSEKLPDAWAGVLVLDDAGDVWKAHYRGEEDGTWGMYSGDADLKVTHWQPLPTPPEGSSK